MRQRVIGALAAALLVTMPAAAAQAPPAPLRCATSGDPDYGFIRDKAVPIGGGPFTAAARERRYLDALRGPAGQVLTHRRTGSMPLREGDSTILDIYEVTYDGQETPLVLYLDVYHFSLPQAPQGFTCARTLSEALGPPPVDPAQIVAELFAAAVEPAPGRALTPVPLGGEGPAARGAVFDFFQVTALRARAGLTMAPPPPTVRPAMIVAAYPITCGGAAVEPEQIEIVVPEGQAPVARHPNYQRGPALQGVLPGVPLPPGSLAALVSLLTLRPTDRVKITYAESAACSEEGVPRDVLLPVSLQPGRVVQANLPSVPDGVDDPDPTIFLRAVIDTDGRILRSTYLAGPEHLTQAAIDALQTWTVTPTLVNGTPIAGVVSFRVTFR